ncbi:hypothetical protein V1477_018431 [Vespula maculifrons]|uniref:Uncharacterized protein n=2 Tax=Vespula TaxID=7451 RepID=A0A834KUD2_VESVU|nr:hypothetical protein HZH66_001077 [Vespula vulgaris]
MEMIGRSAKVEVDERQKRRRRSFGGALKVHSAGTAAHTRTELECVYASCGRGGESAEPLSNELQTRRSSSELQMPHAGEQCEEEGEVRGSPDGPSIIHGRDGLDVKRDVIVNIFAASVLSLKTMADVQLSPRPSQLRGFALKAVEPMAKLETLLPSNSF